MSAAKYAPLPNGSRAANSHRRFDRNHLPDPASYYESQGLTLLGKGRWRTTRCDFHGGSDSMRVNVDSGAFRCMACGQHGGDVIAHAMQANAWEFAEAAENLGAMTRGLQTKRHRTLSAATALKLLQREALVVAMTGLSIQGAINSANERQRLLQAVAIIQNIMQEQGA